MTRYLRKTVALIWLALPPFLLSALIHMADPDINGWRGLWSGSVLWSVSLIGVLFCSFVCICFSTLLEWGRSVFFAATALVSAGCGVVLSIVGSGATSAVGRIRPLAGSTTLVFLTVLVAVIPAAVLGWPRAFARRHGDLRD